MLYVSHLIITTPETPLLTLKKVGGLPRGQPFQLPEAGAKTMCPGVQTPAPPLTLGRGLLGTRPQLPLVTLPQLN